jgi:hypothetical protein
MNKMRISKANQTHREVFIIEVCEREGRAST